MLAIVLSLVLGAVVYYNVKIAKLPIEKILPEGAVVYVQISDIEKRLEEFKTTRLWRNIRDIDVEMLMEKSGSGQEQIKQYRNFKAKFFSSVAELVLHKYFGKEIAVAFYPSKISTFDPNAVSEVASNIILVTRLKPEAEFIEFVSKLFNKFGKKVRITQEQYKGQEITIVELTDKLNIAYVKIRDLLVIGLDKKAAYACLDVVTKDRLPLCRDRDYVLTMSKLPKSAQTSAYVNLGSIFSNIRQLVNKIPENEQVTAKRKAEILKPFDKMAGFKTAGFVSVPGKISNDKTVLFFDKSRMDPFIAEIYSLKPQKNKSINFVPKNVIGYQWSCFDARSTWSYYKGVLSEEFERVPQGPSFAEIIADLEKELGMGIENDVIPALGNEIGGFLSDINLSTPIPIPEVLLFVKINDKSTIENVMATLIKKNDLLVESEEYKNIYIKYIALPFGTSLQPGYCFLGDYLLISTGRKPLKESIDTLADKSMSLLANEDFKAINFGLTDKNNAVYFFKPDLFLHRIRGICEWGFGCVSLMSTQFKTSQQKAEQDLNDLRNDIQIKESELKSLKTKLQSIKNEVEYLQSQELDASYRQQELTGLEEKIKEKKEEINLANKDLEAKEKEWHMFGESPMAKIDTSLVRLYLDKVVYPILEGLQYVKAVGSKTTFSENILETESFSKIEE